MRTEEAEGVIIAGLEKFGYNGKDFTYTIITHEHTDHFEGVAYFQKRFNHYMYASKTAWIAMAW
jgi:metallo-beta-lactamase class B